MSPLLDELRDLYALMSRCGFKKVPYARVSNELVFSRRHHYWPEYIVSVSTGIIVADSGMVRGRLEGYAPGVYVTKGEFNPGSVSPRISAWLVPLKTPRGKTKGTFIERLYDGMRREYRELNRYIREQIQKWDGDIPF